MRHDLRPVKHAAFQAPGGCGTYRQLGQIRSRGAELSLASAVTDRFNVVLGGVLLDPAVTGEDVRQGRVGRSPVGLAKQSADLNVDWRSGSLDGLSLDGGISYKSRIPATPNNLVYIPRGALVDLGGRCRFKLSGKPATLRVSVGNVFDTHGFGFKGRGTYDIFNGLLLPASRSGLLLASSLLLGAGSVPTRIDPAFDRYVTVAALRGRLLFRAGSDCRQDVGVVSSGRVRITAVGRPS